MSVHRWSIVTPTVILTSTVAAVAVVIAALISYPLVVSSSEDQGQRSLSQLANVTAEAVDRQGLGAGALEPTLITTLQRESISAYILAPSVTGYRDLPYGFTQEMAQDLVSGVSLSLRVPTETGQLLYEGRPLAGGGGVLLIQPIAVAGASAQAVIARLLVALGVGLIIAIPLGYFAARRLARPLKRASAAASELTQGHRGVELGVQGPREIADIAEALNALDRALAVSESRSREFLLSVSHELRTPLTAVKGYSEALADGVFTGEDSIHAGELIGKEAKRLDRLVQDLLDLARLGASTFTVNPAELDLTDFSQDVVSVWAYRSQDENVRFRSELSVWGTFNTDSLRLRQIIDNLAENALRVTPSGQEVVIAMSLDSNASLVVEVRDSGPGLTAEDREIAFEPGALYEKYRGVRPVGTGLGLALVGKLAASLKGTAVVGIAPEGGACFRVVVPQLSDFE